MKRIELLMIILAIIIITVLAMLIVLLLNINNTESNNIIGNVNIKKEESQIEYRTYNEVSYQFISDAQMCANYFNIYKNKMQESYEEAYNTLDEEYRNKKFGSVEKFKEYIEKHKEYINNITLASYNRTNYDNYNIYTLKDQYGNVYVFKETAVMEYTVQLDDYTIENEVFNETYNKANNRDKGLLNVDKFFKMINMQDYESAYSVLDNNFKQTYFKTITDFENYMNNKVFRYNKVNYKEYSNKITDIHTYKVVLTDKTQEKQNEVEFNIVMKLLEGTDFTMSFTVD